jgi:hypothetical protein
MSLDRLLRLAERRLGEVIAGDAAALAELRRADPDADRDGLVSAFARSRPGRLADLWAEVTAMSDEDLLYLLRRPSPTESTSED